MGLGDNRKTKKHRQRAAWRKKKSRLRKKMEEGMASPKKRTAGLDVKKKTLAAPAKPAVTRRPT